MDLVELRAAVRAVLLSNGGPLRLWDFLRDFRTLVGQRFPYRRLKFREPEGLLLIMPDVVKISGTGYRSILSGVVNDRVRHIHSADSENTNVGHRRENRRFQEDLTCLFTDPAKLVKYIIKDIKKDNRTKKVRPQKKLDTTSYCFGDFFPNGIKTIRDKKVRHELSLKCIIECDEISDMPVEAAKLGCDVTVDDTMIYKIDNILTFYISEIYNPSKIYIHTKARNRIDIISRQLENFYNHNKNDEYNVIDRNIRNGLLCCYKTKKHYCYRVRIIENSADSTNYIKIFFIDYGNIDYVHIKQLYYLHRQFLDFSPCALRVSLAYVMPGYNKWSLDAMRYIRVIASNCLLTGRILDINVEKKIYYIEMLLEPDKSISIAKELVDMHLAEYDNCWLQFAMKLITERTTHLRELYPSFDMIENGHYPSSWEIDILHDKGIDYEVAINDILFKPNKYNFDIADTKFLFINVFKYLKNKLEGC